MGTGGTFFLSFNCGIGKLGVVAIAEDSFQERKTKNSFC
jgi:hypothetical protein